MGLCGLGAAMREWTTPSLIITSDQDAVKAGMWRAKDILGENATLVTFKDAALNNNNPLAKQTTGFGPFLLCGCCSASPFYGMRRHFALANEEEEPSSAVVAAFLKKALLGGPDIAQTDQMHPLNTKDKDGACCTPFPLFWSCCET